MKLMIVCLLSAAVSTCFPQEPDTLFFDDFSEPGSNPWVYGPLWTFYGESMRMYDQQGTSSGETLFASDTLVSPPVCIPDGMDSLLVSVPMSLYAKCTTINIGSMYNLERISVINGTGTHDIWEFYATDVSYLYVSWEDTVDMPVPASAWVPSDSLRVRFIGESYCHPLYWDGYLEIEWILDSVALLGFGCQELTNSTWGSIKTLLQ